MNSRQAVFALPKELLLTQLAQNFSRDECCLNRRHLVNEHSPPSLRSSELAQWINISLTFVPGSPSRDVQSNLRGFRLSVQQGGEAQRADS